MSMTMCVVYSMLRRGGGGGGIVNKDNLTDSESGSHKKHYNLIWKLHLGVQLITFTLSALVYKNGKNA